MAKKTYIGISNLICDGLITYVGDEFGGWWECPVVNENLLPYHGESVGGYTVEFDGTVYSDVWLSSEGLEWSVGFGDYNVYIEAFGTMYVPDFITLDTTTDHTIKIYKGAESVVKEVKKSYIGGIGGVAKKIKKGYIGDENGIARLFFSGGVDVATMAISYTGNHTDQVVTMGDGKQYRLLTLTSTGTLTLEEKVNAEVWLCNGGKSGSKGSVNTSSKNYYGGNGGAGGNFSWGNVSFDKTTVTIASANGTSSFGLTLSSSGTGAGGGKGGQSVYYNSPRGANGAGGSAASADTRPFKDSYFTQYPCAGGGGGELSHTGTKYYGGCGGSSTTAGATGSSSIKCVGGNTGGGRGGYVAGTFTIASNPGDAATYYGSGGGGGSTDFDNSEQYGSGNGGAGYQGICYIRIPLEQG